MLSNGSSRARYLGPHFLPSGICAVHCGSCKKPNVTTSSLGALPPDRSLPSDPVTLELQYFNTLTVLRNFLLCTRCGDALQRNKQLIASDQRAYQKELEKNFTQLTEQLEPLLRNKSGTLRGSTRQK